VTDLPKNGFLRSLSDSGFCAIRDHIVQMELPLGAHLFQDGQRVEWVYFPETSLLSMIASGSNGGSVETSMAGNEGVAGLVETCGSQVSNIDCVVQVDGRAWRAPAAVCRRLAFSDPVFGESAWRLAELQLLESRQCTVCQTMHTVERRFARWLMESFERCGGRNPLPMTQEFLAALLGVQRSTVSMFASQLQRSGLIRYARGRITLLDIPGLEAQACDCRTATIAQRARLGLSMG
jgi:CRP-like cAMP-binding protein